MGFVAKQNSDFWVFWDTLLDTYRNKVSRWGASDLDPVDREGRKGLAWDGWSGVGPCPPILGTGDSRSPRYSLAQENPVTNANPYTLS